MTGQSEASAAFYDCLSGWTISEWHRGISGIQYDLEGVWAEFSLDTVEAGEMVCREHANRLW